MKKLILALCLMPLALEAGAQTPVKGGGISTDLLARLRSAQSTAPETRALRSALADNDINQLAISRQNGTARDTYFSHEVPSKGITNQLSSGRCWLFTGLNVMRAKMMQRHELAEFTFSQNYVFFYDQLEKSNLFLQAIIDCASKPMDDKRVEWLFKNPLSDGGQFTGIVDLVSKYGLVPSDIMPETYASNNTSHMAALLKLKLREDALRLRQAADKGSKKQALASMKEKQLAEIYHMLTLFLGEPPQRFSYRLTGKDGKPQGTAEEYTPQSFYERYVGSDLKNGYVMLMNDPLRPYYKTYEIDMDRHVYDGENWVYLNLPIEEIKKAAINSIKDSTMMYFSCDVGKFLNSKTGMLDAEGYDFSSFMGTTFGMTKKERIETFASASSHAMTLMAVDLDSEGKPKKWMVENSWGATNGYKGHLIMTDKWFDDYMFRLVVEKKYVSSDILALLEQKPTLLPPWDPMFCPEE